LTTPKLKKIIKEKYNEERKYHQPVYLYEFLIDGYLKWKAKHKMKIALNATKKKNEKECKKIKHFTKFPIRIASLQRRKKVYGIK